MVKFRTKILFILSLMCLIAPAIALTDNLTINVTVIPEWYGIDYGSAMGVVIDHYNISSPVALNDSMNTFDLIGSNDGLFYTVISIVNNQSFLQDKQYSFPILDTTSYKYYVLFLSGGFTAMQNKTLNMTIFSSPTGLSSFVISNVLAINATTQQLDTNLFTNKWFLLIVGIILIFIGLLSIPWIALMGILVYLYKFIIDLSIYTSTEKVFIIVIFFASAILLIKKVR